MSGSLQHLKTYTEFLATVINDLFLVPGLEPAYQQIVKVFSMGMLLILLLALISLLLKFTASVLEPAAKSLAQRPEYILYLSFAFLILLFTSRVHFLVAVLTLLAFLGLDLAARYYLNLPLLAGREQTPAVPPLEKPEAAPANPPSPSPPAKEEKSAPKKHSSPKH